MSEPKRPTAREVAELILRDLRMMPAPDDEVDAVEARVEARDASWASEVEALRAQVDELNEARLVAQSDLEESQAHAAALRKELAEARADERKALDAFQIRSREANEARARLEVALALLRQARPMVWLEGREWKEWHDGRQAALDATPEAPKETT